MSHSPALSAERSSASPHRHSSTSRRKQNIAAYLFVLPFFVVFIAMLIVPLVYSGYLSLFESKLIGGEVLLPLRRAHVMCGPWWCGGALNAERRR